VSQGYTADADPTVWRIVDDRLYVNYSRQAAVLWERDLPGTSQRGIATGRACSGHDRLALAAAVPVGPASAYDRRRA
jgi:hypothetical protein